MTQTSKILGIDLGSKKSGLANSDESRSIAFAWKTLTGNLNDQLTELKSLIIQEGYISLVFGLPDQEGVWKSKITDFTDLLKTELSNEDYSIDIVFQNEDFTSFVAQQNLNEIKQSLPKKKRNKMDTSKDDSEAARIILQQHLDNL